MKLLTKAIEKQLAKYPLGSQDGKGREAKVLVKFFNPYGSGTWLVTEAEKLEDGDWMFFGAAHITDWDLGYFRLSDLTSIRAFGRPSVEREMYAAPQYIDEEWKD